MRHWITLARKRLALRDERGIALIMSLGILFVLTISLGTVIYVTSASARHAEHSNAGQKAYALAEAGVNNAFAVLNASYPNDPAVTDSLPGQLVPPQAAADCAGGRRHRHELPGYGHGIDERRPVWRHALHWCA